MKRPMLLTVVLLLLSSIAYCQMATDVKETITAKEKEVYKAIKAGDMDTFGSYLSDEFMSVTSSGIVDKTQELETIANLKFDSYELSNIRVMEPTDGIGIIVYTLTASGMWGDEEFSGQYYASSTWVETGDGEWRAILHTDAQAAPMEEAVGMQEKQ